MSDQQPGDPRPDEIPAPPPVESPRYEPPPVVPPREFTSNYPRGAQFAFGYVRPPGVYWDSIGNSVSMVFGHWGIYALNSLIAFLILGLAMAPYFAIMFPAILASSARGGSPRATMTLASIGPTMLISFATAFVMLCLASVGVRHAQGNVPQVEDFFLPFRSLGKSLKAALLIAVPTIITQLIADLAQVSLFSSPTLAIFGAHLAGALSLLLYVGLYGALLVSGVAAIFTDIPPIECLKRLFSVLGWNTILLNLLVMVGMMISGVGAILCCVGILISYPVGTNIVALHYIYCFPEENQQMAPNAYTYR